MRKAILMCLAWLAMLPCPAPAGEADVGIVVLHGKWGSPGGQIGDFARAMEQAGLLVMTPEMPWSGRRLYDAGVAAMEDEIGAAVGQLRQRGARTIILAGHSFGAAGAVRYATRQPVDGVIALAPGHYPEGRYVAGMTAASRQQAQALIDDGQADAYGWFDDPNAGGRFRQIRMRAGIYLDFFDPAGPMSFGDNAAAVLPGTAVLWIVGQGEEKGIREMAGRVFERLPKGLAARQAEVPGGHLKTPANSAGVVLDWLRSLPSAAR